jgi:hypothetical protein
VAHALRGQPAQHKLARVPRDLARLLVVLPAPPDPVAHLPDRARQEVVVRYQKRLVPEGPGRAGDPVRPYDEHRAVAQQLPVSAVAAGRPPGAPRSSHVSTDKTTRVQSRGLRDSLMKLVGSLEVRIGSPHGKQQELGPNQRKCKRRWMLQNQRGFEKKQRGERKVLNKPRWAANAACEDANPSRIKFEVVVLKRSQEPKLRKPQPPICFEALIHQGVTRSDYGRLSAPRKRGLTRPRLHLSWCHVP